MQNVKFNDMKIGFSLLDLKTYNSEISRNM